MSAKKLKLAILCSIGLEEALAKEVNFRWDDIEVTLDSGVAFIEVEKYEDAIEICYMLQTSYKVILILTKGSLDEIQIGSAQEWVDTTFAVRSHTDEQSEIERKFGNLIDGKVDLKNPKTTFYSYLIDNNYIFGVDLTGFDTAKRSYKLFEHKDGMRGTTAAAMLMLAQYDNDSILLDPFCGSGVITIEAAHLARNRSINYYNKDKFAFNHLKNFEKYEDVFKELDANEEESNKIYCFADSQKSVRNAEKNAKLAGVNKYISYSRQDVQWLDTKCGEGEVNKIITNIIEPSKILSDKKVEKIYDDFFYSCDFILNGEVYALCRDSTLLKKVAQIKGYCISEIEFYQGKSPFKIVTLKKK